MESLFLLAIVGYLGYWVVRGVLYFGFPEKYAAMQRQKQEAEAIRQRQKSETLGSVIGSAATTVLGALKNKPH